MLVLVLVPVARGSRWLVQLAAMSEARWELGERMADGYVPAAHFEQGASPLVGHLE